MTLTFMQHPRNLMAKHFCVKLFLINHYIMRGIIMCLSLVVEF